MLSSPDVLIVDDDPAIVSFLAVVLTDAGYHVRSAYDAAGAMRALDTDRPDLILLDYAMPRVSGRDVLLQIRTTDMSDIPIIIMSATVRAERCMQEGATAFLPKPFEVDELLACLAQYTPI